MAKKRAPRQRGGRPKTAPAILVAQQRKLKIYEMRKEGKGYRQIAKAVGVTRMHVFRTVIEMMAAYAKQIEAEKLDIGGQEWAITDELLNEWIQPALSGDRQAASLVLDILARRARYRGLDSPTKIEAGVSSNNFHRILDRTRLEEEIRNRLRVLNEKPTTQKGSNGSTK